ncbi:MFS transporter [Roseinatronobacter sp. S2]|uniref:MFS transporter n=1 Tax=Roseinatronobacter sp. S2 TaxID=3035471 RepID=UPI00240FC381|nr:MFS transporter [Roseinatronobacter sp. S2]WFE73994.1 MFS transporter [Roseinatronobacter sp. S2]
MTGHETINPTPRALPRRATKREWIGLGVLALPTLLLAMDMTVLHLAVPSLSAALEPSSSQLLWIVDIYGFMIAGFLIIMGNIGDWIGRRKLLMIGAAAFGFASVLAAFAPTTEMLIAARALLGVAGATLMPSTLSLIRNMFDDPAQRTTAVTVWMTSFMIGAIIGPLVGGVMLVWFWWGSVFLLAVPVMLLLLIAGPVLLPEFRNDEKSRLDPPSVVMALAAILLLVFALKEAAKYGSIWQIGAAALTGLAIGTLFVRRQIRLEDPLLDLKLFRNTGFTASLASLSLAVFAISGAMFLIYQYLQGVLGLSPLEAGLWLLPSSLAGPLVAFAVPALSQRIAPNRLIAAGLATGAVSLFLFAMLGQFNGLAMVVGGMTLLSIGMTPVGILGTDLIISSAPAKQAGAASAISETGTELGMALGIALFGSLATAIYKTGFASGVGADIPAALTDRASETLGAAIAVAAQAEAGAGTAILQAARDAFTSGLQISALGAAIVSAGVALMALRYLPKTIRTAGEQAPDSAGPAEASADAIDLAS